MLWNLNRQPSTVFFELAPSSEDIAGAVYGIEEWERTYQPAEWAESMRLDSIFCPRHPGHQRPAARTTDLKIVLPSPNIGDFVWTWYSEALITEQVLDLFKRAGLSGFEARPVTVERVKRARKGAQIVLPKLYELKIIGQAGHAHPRSGVREIYRCSACGLVEYSSYKRGIIVDESQWAGSDFFTVIEYPAIILITERAKNLIVEHDLKPCTIIPSHKMRWPWGVVRPESSY